MSSPLDKIKNTSIEKDWKQRNNVNLGKEYHMQLGDDKVHNLTPVQSYANGRYYGVVVDNNRYVLMTKEQFEKLMYRNKDLNKDIDTRDAKFEKAEHDNTDNKQEPQKKNKDIQYSSITIYDISDNGDASDSRSISVIMDRNGNMFSSNGTRIYRTNEELKLDLENDTGKFYADWMDARGTPIDKNDMLERGIDPDIIDDMYQLSSGTIAELEDREDKSMMEQMRTHEPQKFVTSGEPTREKDIPGYEPDPYGERTLDN